MPGGSSAAAEQCRTVGLAQAMAHAISCLVGSGVVVTVLYTKGLGADFAAVVCLQLFFPLSSSPESILCI